APGLFSPGILAEFDGDVHYAPSQTSVDVTVVAGTPTITWPTPGSITYGTALGVAQLNATANTPGTFEYSPAPGPILDAGTHTLSVTFTPNDTLHWNAATWGAEILVNKATPVVTITGGTFTYDGQPHPGVATATGALGEALSPVQIFYNNVSAPAPV